MRPKGTEYSYIGSIHIERCYIGEYILGICYIGKAIGKVSGSELPRHSIKHGIREVEKRERKFDL